MKPSASLAAVIIQQAGNLLYLALWVVAAQYLMTMVQGKPEESWVWQCREAWRSRRARAEAQRLAIWTRRESSTEPKPSEG
jgi:hypothetical protein